MLKFVQTRQTLTELGKEAQKGLIDNLDNTKVTASGKLRRSIKPFIPTNRLGMQIKGASHWQAVEGERWVGDKKNNLYKNIFQWTKDKKIKPYATFGKGVKARKALAFVIMRNIRKDGQQGLPKPFLQPFLNTGFMKKAQSRIAEAYEQDIRNQIQDK